MKRILFLLFFSIYIKADEFLYPIAYDQLNNAVYVIHQKSLFSIELFSYEPIKKTYTNLLPKVYNPGGIKLLPNNKGFSFIDQGRLRIKYFDQEQPVSINFFEPIYDISLIEWIDENNCYFSAKRDNRSAIFELNIVSQNIVYIKLNKDTDCVYPQKIDSDLFYIERETSENYRTTKYGYKIKKTVYSKDLSDCCETVLDKKSNPIAFLKMISKNEGFFIEHPNIVDKQEKFIILTFFYLYKNELEWKSKELFSFKLPIKFIFGANNERLYESILPFLPRYINNKVLYCSSSDENSNVNIYSYDMLTEQSMQKTSCPNEQELFFSPVICADRVFYGYLLKQTDKNQPYFNF